MDAALRALADPSRRRILRLVRGRELPAGAIAAEFELSRPAISQHLRVLKEAGLLSERRVATSRLYRAREEALQSLIGELETFWDVALADLKREAEKDQRAKERGA